MSAILSIDPPAAIGLSIDVPTALILSLDANPAAIVSINLIAAAGTPGGPLFDDPSNINWME